VVALVVGDELRIKKVLNFIKSELKISSLLKSFGRYDSEINKGSYVMIACPFHEDALPSFSVSDEKGVCHCFSCGFSGTYVTVFRKLWKTIYYSDISFVNTLDLIIGSDPEISARLGFSTVKLRDFETVDESFKSKRLRPCVGKPEYRVSDVYQEMTAKGFVEFDDIALAQAMVFGGIVRLDGIIDILVGRRKPIAEGDEVEFVSAAEIMKGLFGGVL
jgi:molybdopterin converting factor small subunit